MTSSNRRPRSCEPLTSAAIRRSASDLVAWSVALADGVVSVRAREDACPSGMDEPVVGGAIWVSGPTTIVSG